MILHETGVSDGPGGRDDANTAVGFLHYDGEDEASVYAGRSSNLEDGRFDVGDFFGGVVGAPAVVGARLLHDGDIGGEHGVEVDPGVLGGPASGDSAVAGVHLVGGRDDGGRGG